jgi:hypothetical protein
MQLPMDTNVDQTVLMIQIQKRFRNSWVSSQYKKGSYRSSQRKLARRKSVTEDEKLSIP